MAVDLEKAIEEARRQVDSTARWAREQLEEAIKQAQAEAEVRKLDVSKLRDAAGLIVRDFEIFVPGGYQQPGKDLTHLDVTMRSCYGFIRTGQGSSEQCNVGSEDLPVGQYRAIILFYKRGA